jgi:hypothetical protein
LGGDRLVRENDCCKSTRENSRGSGRGQVHGGLPSPSTAQSYSNASMIKTAAAAAPSHIPVTPQVDGDS